MIRILEGRKASNYQLYCDYVSYITNRRRSYNMSLPALDKDAFTLDPIDAKLDIELICGSLQGRDRDIFMLRNKWGYSLQEIGDRFGCSEATISLELKSINELIRQVFR